MPLTAKYIKNLFLVSFIEQYASEKQKEVKIKSLGYNFTNIMKTERIKSSLICTFKLISAYKSDFHLYL